MATMDQAERIKICKLIEGVICADGFVREEEREFLRRVVQRFDIPYDLADVGPVSAEGPESDPGRAARYLRELDPTLQARVLALLVDSAVTDGEVAPTERALLLVAAAALDIDATAVEERIQERLDRVNEGL